MQNVAKISPSKSSLVSSPVSSPSAVRAPRRCSAASVAKSRIGEAVDELLARTERVLHVAKKFGRDRVEVAASPPHRVERAKVVGLYD
jgi:hypothetical protein